MQPADKNCTWWKLQRLRLQLAYHRAKGVWQDFQWFIRKQFLSRDVAEAIDRDTAAKLAALRERTQQQLERIRSKRDA